MQRRVAAKALDLYILSTVQLFSVGERIDNRYDITSLLGYGGMAQVFRAYDRHLDREVALKVLRPHLTESDQERFRREIKALAKLSHPGIVSIYDLGRGEHVYFAMELITGGTMTDMGPLESELEPMLRFLRTAIAVAETLAYVHDHGMVHRDLTPRNILLTERGHPKVMDFGLVQLAEVSRDLTRTGFTLGTPQYMAPEQARGEAIGPHTDLYAFGAVLYKALTGTAPFEADNDQAILYQHVYGNLTPPHEVNPGIPASLSQLVVALLAKEPAQRPASGYQVADALRSIKAQIERHASAQRLGGGGQHGVLVEGPVAPRRLEQSWQIKFDEGPQWPAALTAAEGFVLLGLRSEEVCAVSPADGSLQARFVADDEVNSAVTYLAHRLYFTSRGGALYALAWPSGKRLWQDAHSGVVGLLGYGDGLLLTTSQHQGGGLEHRTLDNARRWHYPTESPAVTAPLVQQRQACFMTQDGWLHCVDALTGEGRFKVKVGHVAAQPSAKDGVLLLPERAGDLHAFDMRAREVLWSYDTEGQLWSSPVLWGPYLYVASWSGVVRCLALRSGDDIWAVDLGSRVTATPVLAGGVLYVVSEEGDVLALDARSGEALFHDRLGLSPIQASPLIYQQTLIVAALDGTVTAYRCSSMERS